MIIDCLIVPQNAEALLILTEYLVIACLVVFYGIYLESAKLSCSKYQLLQSRSNVFISAVPALYYSIEFVENNWYSAAACVFQEKHEHG